MRCVQSTARSNRWADIPAEGERDGSKRLPLHGGPELQDLHGRKRRHHHLSLRDLRRRSQGDTMVYASRCLMSWFLAKSWFLANLRYFAWRTYGATPDRQFPVGSCDLVTPLSALLVVVFCVRVAFPLPFETLHTQVPFQLSLGIATTLTAGLGLLPRALKGGRYTPVRNSVGLPPPWY